MLRKLKIKALQLWVNTGRHVFSKSCNLLYHAKIMTCNKAMQKVKDQYAGLKLCKTEQDAVDFLYRQKRYKPDPLHGKADWSGSLATCLYRDDFDCDDFAVLTSYLLQNIYGGTRKQLAFIHPHGEAHCIGYIEKKDKDGIHEGFLMDYHDIVPANTLTQAAKFYHKKYCQNKGSYEDVIILNVPEVQSPKGIFEEDFYGI